MENVECWEVVVWCRKEELYNLQLAELEYSIVVVWCRKEELYNLITKYIDTKELWFDVEKKNYTTHNARFMVGTSCGLM